MESLEYKILSKKQELKDLLTFALSQTPIYLPVVKEIRYELTMCERALKQLYSRRVYTQLG